MQLLDRALPYLLGLGLLLAALGVSVWLHQSRARSIIATAVEAERVRLEDAHRSALAEANLASKQETTNAAMAALEAQIELSTLRQTMERDRAVSRVRTDSLQRTIAEFRDRAASEAAGTGPGSVAHEAISVADALGECSARREEVAAVADKLAVQVTGLQRYIVQVVGPICVAGMSNSAD